MIAVEVATTAMGVVITSFTQPNIQGKQCHVEGAYAPCYPENMPPAKIFGKRPFELSNFIAGREDRSRYDIRNLVELGLSEVMLIEGNGLRQCNSFFPFELIMGI